MPVLALLLYTPHTHTRAWVSQREQGKVLMKYVLYKGRMGGQEVLELDTQHPVRDGYLILSGAA